jgi:hypothetical protein
LSPQSRRGRAAPPSHRKSASHAAQPAARKPSAQVEAFEDEEPVETRPATPKREGKPVRRKRTLSKVRRSSAARYGGEWIRAYAPLFAVAIAGFFALWAWVSFGPHTPTPKDNWTQIESVWKPKRDADIQKVSAAVQSGDFAAQLAAYKALDEDTKGWMGALAKISDWGDASATAAPGQPTNSAQAISMFLADGNAISALLDTVITSSTPNDVLAQKESLLADEQAFATDYETARRVLAGSEPNSSPVPTLAFPPGTYTPPGSPSPSESAGPSPTSTASPTPTATDTPAPSPSPSPAPSAS